MIGTIEFEGSKYDKQQESITTSSRNKQLSVKVTDVEVDDALIGGAPAEMAWAPCCSTTVTAAQGRISYTRH